MKKGIAILLLLMLFMPQAQALQPGDLLADGENDGDITYRMYDEQGEYLTSHGGRIFVDDELITADDQLYRVISVDDAQLTALAQHVGAEPLINRDDAVPVMAGTAQAEETAEPDENAGDGKLICMYSTHSDESYENGDGTFSKESNAGIYDIGDSLKKEFEQMGYKVEYSKETSLPHNAGAYRRSRQIAEDFIKQQPVALLDIHRDGIPDPSEYTTEVDGEETTKVRLFVGRNNPNSSSNRAFAKEIKKDADKKYPGLIKDIFIGKGNYNQDLYPKALLLEMGTHTSDKDDVEKSTKYIADVIGGVLGGTANAAGNDGVAGSNGAGATGIAWLVGLAILGGAIYALVATGTLGNWKTKLARGTSEITGGMIGKKPDNRDDH